MPRKGRPRKAGERNKGGRLKQPHDPRIIPPSGWTKARWETFGSNAADPLGRAYVMGLLGQGEQAKDRLQAGRKYAAIYRRCYVRSYRSALNDSPRGDAVPEIGEDAERAKAARAWLDEQTRRVVATGFDGFFEQLVDQFGRHSDGGPEWLDQLIAVEVANRARDKRGQPRQPADERDWMVLRLALKGLDAILPDVRPAGIIAVRTIAA